MDHGRLISESRDTATARRARMVAAFALAGLLLGLLSSQLRTPSYASIARVAVLNPIGSIQAEAEVMRSDQVLARAERSLGFVPDVVITSIDEQKILTVESVASTAQQAADAATALANAYQATQVASAVQIVQQGEPANAPFAPNSNVYMLVGTALGALLGFASSQVLRVASERRYSAVDEAQAAEVAERLTPEEPAVVVLGPERAMPTSSVSTPVRSDNTVRSHAQTSLAPAANTPADSTNERQKPHSGQPGSEGRPAHPQKVAASILPQPSVVALPAEDNVATSDAPTRRSAERRRRAASNKIPNGAAPDTSGSSIIWQDSAHDLDATIDQTADDDTPVEQTADAAALTSAQITASNSELGGVMVTLQLEHDREVLGLRAEIARVNKELHAKIHELNERRSPSQTRVGDLEAQVDLLERELERQRARSESERIAHVRELADDRLKADRKLDAARRRFRRELEKHDSQKRAATAKAQQELDATLERHRNAQAAALEKQHLDYEAALEQERKRQADFVAAARERFENELSERTENDHRSLTSQTEQHRQAITDLRRKFADADAEAAELRTSVRRLQRESEQARSLLERQQVEQTALVAKLTTEKTTIKSELAAEQARNEALRSDLERRTKQTNDEVSATLSERGRQLKALEESLNQQRAYADERVREVSEDAEERARLAAAREAELLAVISRLERAGRSPEIDTEAL